MTTEDRIFAAVLAELDGLGRLAPLLARDDVEDIHTQFHEGYMIVFYKAEGGRCRPRSEKGRPFILCRCAVPIVSEGTAVP